MVTFCILKGENKNPVFLQPLRCSGSIDSRAELTDEYAAVAREMKTICACFGKEAVTQTPQSVFYCSIPQIYRLYSGVEREAEKNAV